MRFCLRCHHFSGGGPLCNQCGRSFGGRLCQGRTRHLNLYDAQFCSHCGTPALTEGAMSFPLGWLSRLLVLGGLFLVGRWLFWNSSYVNRGKGPEWSVQSLTRGIDVRIWIFEKFAHFLILLLTFSFLSALIPGEAGKQFRAVMFGLIHRSIALIFKILECGLGLLGKLLLRALGFEIPTGKKK